MSKSNRRKQKINPPDGQIYPSAAADIRARMRKRLEDTGMDRKELAARTGESHGNVTNWLAPRKTTRIPADFLVRFAAVVPTNLEWLLFGRGDPEPTPPSPAVLAVSAIRTVLDTLEKDPDRFGRFIDWWSEEDDGEDGSDRESPPDGEGPQPWE